ncbi:MAG: FecR domain-containing protein, partial [Candidatus Auribacterota bacterium]|nr:FecR domain-containing protein [Candidatus Auribacterota bacterium]
YLLFLKERILGIILGGVLAVGIFPGEILAEETFSFAVRDGSTAQTLSRDYLNKPDDWKKVVEYNDLLKPGQIIKVPAELIKTGGKAFFSEVCCGSNVIVKPAGTDNLITARPGLIIEKGDYISTGLNSGAEITFANGDKAVIRQMTRLIFAPYSDEKPTNLLKIFSGKVISLIKKTKNRDVRYEIQTPTAVSLVRGTRFRTKVDDDGETKFEVLQGVVEVETDSDDITLRENFGVKIPAPVKDN